MQFLNKKNKIQFFHNEPSIIENFPIIESKALKLKWVDSVKQDFQNLVKEGVDGSISSTLNRATTEATEFNHLSRCPGIFDLFKYGYVISLHKDVILNFEGKKFEWRAKGNHPPHLENFRIMGQPASNIRMIAKPPWASEVILKINTGWNVIAPKGVKFLQLPIAYPDTFEFTAAIGILDPALATQINFQIFWNGTVGETVLRAGTPLGHLIPLSEKKYQMVQRNMNQRDQVWVEKVSSIYNSTFWRPTVRRKVVDMYNKYWKR